MLKRDRSIIIFIAILLYRIPLSRIIGDNGMGFLSGPMEIYICLLFAFGSGIACTMQGMMYDRIRRDQYKNAGQVYKLGRRYTIIVSLILLIICPLIFDSFSTRILADSGQRLAFLLVGPAVFLGLYIRLNVGYLIGTENGQAAVLGQLIEAVAIGIGMIVGAYMGIRYGAKVAALLLNSDVEAMYGALGVMCGLCAGELVALLVLMIMTVIYQRSFRHMINSDSGRRVEYSSDISGKLIGGIVKDGAQNLIIQLPVIVLLVIYRKYAVAMQISDANNAVGAFYSKYLSVIGFVSAFAVIFIQSSMKGISAAINDSEDQIAGERISKLFGRIMYFAIPATVFVAMLSNAITQTLFTGRITTVNSLLGMGSSLIVVYSLMYLVLTILNRLGYNMEILFVGGLAFVLMLIAGIIFVGKRGMEFKGIVIIMIINYAVNALFGLFILFRNYKLRLYLMQYVLIPLIISGIIGIVIKLLAGALIGVAGGAVTLIVCLIPAWFLYNIACMFLRVVSAGAMEKKMFGHILVHIGQRMGVY